MSHHARKNVIRSARPLPDLSVEGPASPMGREDRHTWAVREQNALCRSSYFEKHRRVFLASILSLVFLSWPSLLTMQPAELKLDPEAERIFRAYFHIQGFTEEAVNASINRIQKGLAIVEATYGEPQKQQLKLDNEALGSALGIS